MKLDRKKFLNPYLIHSLKTGIAIVLGLVLTRWLSFAQGQWVVITIIVVMSAQIHVGNVLEKGYLRFIGTVCGCLYAIFIIKFLGQNLWIIAVGLFLAGVISSAFSTRREDLSYAGTMAGATIAIIILGDDPTVSFALERFMEISLGILIATLVSQFLFPIHAKTQLLQAQIKTLVQLKKFYKKNVMRQEPVVSALDYHSADEHIVQLLLKQRELAKGSKRELLGIHLDFQRVAKVLFLERQMLRAMTFMLLAQDKLQEHNEMKETSERLENFHQQVLEELDFISDLIEQKKLKKDSCRASVIAKLGIEEGSQNGLYDNAFVFNAEVLVDSLQALRQLYTFRT